MEKLQDKIRYQFRDSGLLATALTHSSCANENRRGGLVSNERLEFLGDSILGFVTANHLYHLYPDMAEGRMTRLRAELVCEQSLYQVAEQLDLGSYIRLGRGEEHTGGRTRPSILADAVEALIAAMYLDGGIGVARGFINTYILAGLDESGQGHNRDYKTSLQELIQQKSGQVLAYAMVDESGPDHQKVFTAQVSLNAQPIGTGSGRTKKEAEQDAARAALEALEA